MDTYIVIPGMSSQTGIHLKYASITVMATQQLSDNNVDMEEKLTAPLSLLVKENLGFDIPFIECVACMMS